MRRIVGSVFLDFNDDFEGHCLHPYLDTKGLITTGVGNLIDDSPRSPPWSSAISLPWKVDWRLISTDEVVRQFVRLKSFAVPESTIKEWREKHGGARLPLQLRGGDTDDMRAATTMRLTKEDVTVLVRRRLLEMASVVREQFGEFDTWPADAQLALLSVAWARGPNGFASGFPNMTAALKRRDFVTAAAECGLAGGYEDRDAANRRCFLAAARCERDGLNPELLHYADAAPPSVVDVALANGIRAAIEADVDDHEPGES